MISEESFNQKPEIYSGIYVDIPLERLDVPLSDRLSVAVCFSEQLSTVAVQSVGNCAVEDPAAVVVAARLAIDQRGGAGVGGKVLLLRTRRRGELVTA